MTVTEDETRRDPALGGPDTAVRNQRRTVAVHRYPRFVRATSRTGKSRQKRQTRRWPSAADTRAWTTGSIGSRSTTVATSRRSSGPATTARRLRPFDRRPQPRSSSRRAMSLSSGRAIISRWSTASRSWSAGRDGSFGWSAPTVIGSRCRRWRNLLLMTSSTRSSAAGTTLPDPGPTGRARPDHPRRRPRRPLRGLALPQPRLLADRRPHGRWQRDLAGCVGRRRAAAAPRRRGPPMAGLCIASRQDRLDRPPRSAGPRADSPKNETGR